MFNKKGQSLLEYGILLAVVIAALLIMQSFIKRGYQGSLKSSIDKIGEQFSTSGTTMKTKQTRPDDQITKTRILQDAGVYTSTVSTGGEVTIVTEKKMDSAALEKTRFSDYSQYTVSDPINDPDLPQ